MSPIGSCTLQLKRQNHFQTAPLWIKGKERHGKRKPSQNKLTANVSWRGAKGKNRSDLSVLTDGDRTCKLMVRGTGGNGMRQPKSNTGDEVHRIKQVRDERREKEGAMCCYGQLCLRQICWIFEESWLRSWGGGSLIWAVTMINGPGKWAMEITQTPALPCMSSAQLKQDAVEGSAVCQLRREETAPLPPPLLPLLFKTTNTCWGAGITLHAQG